MNRKIAITTMMLLAGSAMGQSVNIDLNGSGKPAPSSLYGGVAGQPGVWNAITATGAGAGANLVGLNGASSGLTIVAKSSNGNTSGDLGSGDFGSLMDDYAMGFDTNGIVTVEINGLDEGFYRAYVYAALTPSDQTYVDGFGFTNYHTSQLYGDIGGSSIGSASTSGPTTPNVFQLGKTHAVFNFKVAAGAPKLKINSQCAFVSLAKCAFNGLQLVKITGNRLYVNDNAAGANTGLSWTDAFTNLQEALSVAKASGGQITEIWVAGGSYTPGTQRTSSFKLVDGVKMYGGFVGNEATLGQRVLSVANQSHLSGAIGTGLSNDNCYHVVDASGVSYQTELDGFTIDSGYANGAPPNEAGAGLYGVDCSPTVRNCTFTANYALHGGGGVYIDTPAGLIGPRFESCTFFNNSAEAGAALQYWGGPGGFLAPVLSVTSCRFFQNTAGSYGGAVRSYGDAWFYNTAMWGNSATTGGGAIYITGTNVDVYLRNCTIVNNYSTNGTGGVNSSAGADIDMRNSIAYGNTGPGLMIPTAKQVNAGGGVASVSYSCVTPDFVNQVIAGVGNIGSAPSFIDQAGSDNVYGNSDDDFRLAAGSPCIDTGNNPDIASFTLDIAGNPRIVDGDAVAGGRVDMGAFERQLGACPCDLNHDGMVDDADFSLFVGAYNTLDCGDASMPAGCPADFNEDGLVDDDDFVLFVVAYNELLCP
ncbi:MAG: hypothetical protein JSS51_14690 [Planctomycetes bacterium]|nr:hypothetical protein [Planctomycetota bacterium]